MAKEDFGYREETKASEAQLQHREVLYRLFAERPLPDDQLLTCLGLYMRSSALAKILFLDELYREILDLPGVIMEFGTWWGQNLTVFENLRAIYEPFNPNRRIIGFDTFTGYPSVSDRDRASETIKVGGYKVSADYQQYLEALLDYHEQNNILGNIKKHEVIAGDVTQTVPHYFEEHPETVVALAYFDLALYAPTRACFEALKPHLIHGSVLMLDEFNSRDYPGETLAFKEVFSGMNCTLRRSRFMTDRTIVTVGRP